MMLQCGGLSAHLIHGSSAGKLQTSQATMQDPVQVAFKMYHFHSTVAKWRVKNHSEVPQRGTEGKLMSGSMAQGAALSLPMPLWGRLVTKGGYSLSAWSGHQISSHCFPLHCLCLYAPWTLPAQKAGCSWGTSAPLSFMLRVQAMSCLSKQLETKWSKLSCL